MARVLIVDDNEAVRYLARQLLNKDCEICGEARDGEEAVAQATALKPDVVLLDLAMPKMTGMEAAKAIAQNVGHVRMILWTVQEIDDALIEAAQRAGFQAVLKKSDGYLLTSVIDIVLHGGTVFSHNGE